MGDFCRILDLIRQALDYRSNPTTINGSQTTYTTCTYDANGERLMRYNQTHYYYYYYDGVNPVSYTHLDVYKRQGVGAAKSFNYHKSHYRSANCLGFACGININVNSNKLKVAYKNKYKKNFDAIRSAEYNVEQWFKATAAYLGSKKIWVRRLSYYTDPIFPNERRIALRCRKKLRIVNGQRYDKDYHFLCQTANTTWAGKFGDSNSYESNKRTPASAWKEYYDSPIIYFAISNKQYK